MSDAVNTRLHHGFFSPKAYKKDKFSLRTDKESTQAYTKLALNAANILQLKTGAKDSNLNGKLYYNQNSIVMAVMNENNLIPKHQSPNSSNKSIDFEQFNNVDMNK
jgi:hypothetical protein